MGTIARLASLCAISLCLMSCGGGSATAPVTKPSGGGGNKPPTFPLSGRIQKGPFAIGSQISVNSLDSKLSPTGTVYNTQTSDALGNFSVTGKVAGPNVEIVAQGFYLDELSGQLSASQIQLRAISDLSANSTPTVNVLTTLQEQRLKELVSKGASIASAKSQSEKEVLALFEIDSTKLHTLTTFDSMRIDGTSDPDAALLAISALLSQMATDKAQTNGTTQAAELSNLVNTVAAEIAGTGTLSSPSFVSERNLAATEIVASAIAANLETYYANNGETVTAPDFAQWIDQNETGILPQQASLEYVYVSNVTSGTISECQLNQTSGVLEVFGTVNTGANAQGIVATHNGKFLYVSASDEGKIYQYSIDPTTHALSFIAKTSAGTFSGIPTVDPTDSFLYVTDQSSNVLLEYTINPSTGALASNGSIGAGTGPWTVTVDPSGKYAFVPDGSSVLQYIIAGDGTLTANGSAAASTGAVAISFTPDGKYAYNSNSSAGNATAFSLNSGTGVLTPLGNTPTGTNPFYVATNGTFAYIADVGTDDVAEYSINGTTGALTSIGSATNSGTGVETVVLDPSGKFLLVGILGSSTGQIAAYSIDSGTGALTLAPGSKTVGKGPVSIAIVQ